MGGRKSPQHRALLGGLSMFGRKIEALHSSDSREGGGGHMRALG